MAEVPGKLRHWKTMKGRHASERELARRSQRGMLGRMDDGATWCMGSYSRRCVC